MANTTPVTTKQGTDPYAGYPGTDPIAGATTPTATPANPVGTPAGMPTFVAGGGSSNKTTFGVPSKLSQPIGVPGLGGQITLPNYVENDQFLPGQDPNPDVRRALQLQMIHAGLLKLADVHLGIWDGASANAYSKVLAWANLSGLPASVALDQYVSSSARLPAKTINPDDLTGIANNAAENILGRKLQPDELARFNTAFSSAVLSPGGPQSAAGEQNVAERLVTQQNPKEAAATSLHQVSQKALDILTGPSIPQVNYPS